MFALKSQENIFNLFKYLQHETKLWILSMIEGKHSVNLLCAKCLKVFDACEREMKQVVRGNFSKLIF